MNFLSRFLIISIVTLSIAGCLDSLTVSDSNAFVDGSGLKGNYYKNISHFDTGYIELTLDGPVGNFGSSINGASILVRYKNSTHLYGCSLGSADALNGAADMEADLLAYGAYDSDSGANETGSLYIGSNFFGGNLSANNVFTLTDLGEKKFGCGITRDGNGVETITAYINRQPISQYAISSTTISIPTDGSTAINDPGLDHDGLAGFSLQSDNSVNPLKIKSFVIYDKVP